MRTSVQEVMCINFLSVEKILQKRKLCIRCHLLNIFGSQSRPVAAVSCSPVNSLNESSLALRSFIGILFFIKILLHRNPFHCSFNINSEYAQIRFLCLTEFNRIHNINLSLTIQYFRYVPAVQGCRLEIVQRRRGSAGQLGSSAPPPPLNPL